MSTIQVLLVVATLIPHCAASPGRDHHQFVRIVEGLAEGDFQSTCAKQMVVDVKQLVAKDKGRILPMCAAMEKKTFPKHESLAAGFEREVLYIHQALQTS